MGDRGWITALGLVGISLSALASMMSPPSTSSLDQERAQSEAALQASGLVLPRQLAAGVTLVSASYGTGLRLTHTVEADRLAAAGDGLYSELVAISVDAYCPDAATRSLLRSNEQVILKFQDAEGAQVEAFLLTEAGCIAHGVE